MGVAALCYANSQDYVNTTGTVLTAVYCFEAGWLVVCWTWSIYNQVGRGRVQTRHRTHPGQLVSGDCYRSNLFFLFFFLRASVTMNREHSKLQF